jgi:hypothetical protein
MAHRAAGMPTGTRRMRRTFPEPSRSTSGCPECPAWRTALFAARRRHRHGMAAALVVADDTAGGHHERLPRLEPHLTSPPVPDLLDRTHRQRGSVHCVGAANLQSLVCRGERGDLAQSTRRLRGTPRRRSSRRPRRKIGTVPASDQRRCRMMTCMSPSPPSTRSMTMSEVAAGA